MVDVVRDGFERFIEEGPAAIRDLLDPDVEMFASEAGPWDCHGRDAVLCILDGFWAGGGRAGVLEVTEYRDRLLFRMHRQRPGDGDVEDRYSVITVRKGRVRLIQAYGSRDAALAAITAPV